MLRGLSSGGQSSSVVQQQAGDGSGRWEGLLRQVRTKVRTLYTPTWVVGSGRGELSSGQLVYVPTICVGRN